MQRIGFVVSPGFRVMSFAVASVFEFANVEMSEPVYDVHLLSETGGSVRTSIGVSVATEPFDDTNFDTLIVGRGTQPPTPGLIEFVRRAPGRCRRVAATCLGAFVLAEAGLLDGRRATTNKRAFKWVAEQGAKVNWIREARWVEDGKFATSSGVSAGIDMALAVMARLYGADTAEQIAIAMEYEWHRDARWDPFAKIHGLV